MKSRFGHILAAGALGAAAPILESIPDPPGGASWSWVRVIHSYVVNDKIDILLLFRPDSEYFDVWKNAKNFLIRPL